ncbi:MAG: hypothetical protein LBK70_01660 [Clostridiales bacterium]|jgi:hypothetical protein|nr:hypothetical protein [Clostridiales bacterium]
MINISNKKFTLCAIFFSIGLILLSVCSVLLVQSFLPKDTTIDPFVEVVSVQTDNGLEYISQQRQFGRLKSFEQDMPSLLSTKTLDVATTIHVRDFELSTRDRLLPIPKSSVPDFVRDTFEETVNIAPDKANQTIVGDIVVFRILAADMVVGYSSYEIYDVVDLPVYVDYQDNYIKVKHSNYIEVDYGSITLFFVEELIDDIYSSFVRVRHFAI